MSVPIHSITMSSSFCFNHLDPNGTVNSYTKEQSASFASAILGQPHGGTLAIPGYGGQFELRWGDQASSWKTLLTPAKSGIYQVNISFGLSNGNTRDVEVAERDAWNKAWKDALAGRVAAVVPLAGYPVAGGEPICITPGCGKPTWNKHPGEYCGKSCKDRATGCGALVTPMPVLPVAAAVQVVQQPRQPQYRDERVPDAPASFPELTGLSQEQLCYLQANSLALDDWLVELPQVKRCAERAQKIREEHTEVANNILSQESQFISLGLRCERSNDALCHRQASVQALLVRRDRVLLQQGSQQLACKLQALAQRSDIAADRCLQQAQTAPGVLDAGGVADFRQRYIRQKAEKHTRLALCERLVASDTSGAVSR